MSPLRLAAFSAPQLAMAVLGLPVVVLLRDLAPGDALDTSRLAHTIWEPGMRLVRDGTGTPILASEIEVGDLVNAAPEARFPPRRTATPSSRAPRSRPRRPRARSSSSA